MRRRTFIKGAASVAAIASTAAPAAAARADRVRLTRHRLPWPGSGPYRIAHLTDIHVGLTTPQRRLSQAATLAQLVDPDLVVLTGDYLNHSLHWSDRLRRFVRVLPRPCIATLGNHDHWSDAQGIADALSAEGVTVLRNQHQIESLQNGNLTVVGIDDSFTDHADPERAFAGVDPQRALVLTHDPSLADSLRPFGAPIILAGHTHGGGQVNIPSVTDTVLRAFGMRYVAGWYPVGDSRLFVNAGVGCTGMPWRIGKRAQAEVAVIDLG